MSNKKCDLPDTSWRAMKKGYEEVHVPAVRSVIPKNERLVSIADLPRWTHSAFKGFEKLNRVQSKMCDIALQSSENLLLCAPTGAGKTNVACLAMLNILGQYRKERTGDDSKEKESFDLNSFKIVYVAPMKALVQEVVKNFSHRLSEYGVVVRELSGDSSLTRQQIAETQLLVVSVLIRVSGKAVFRNLTSFSSLLQSRLHLRNGTSLRDKGRDGPTLN